MNTSAPLPPVFPSEPPPLSGVSAPSPSSAKKYLNLLVGGVVAIVVGFITYKLAYNSVARRGIPGAASAEAPAQDGWKHKTLAGLEFDSPPIELVRTDVMRILPIETQARMVSMQTYLTQPTNAPFQVSVLRTTFKPEFPLDLNGAMQGALQNAAASAHVSNPDLKFEDSTLGNFPVKRGRLDGQKGNEQVHIEIMGFQRNQTMWQVQAIFANEARRAEAERLLKSIVPPPIQ